MKKVPLVLLGFGNVGQALARLIDERQGFKDQGLEVHLIAVFDQGGAVLGEHLPADELVETKREKGTVAGHTRLGRSDVSPMTVLGGEPGAILVDASPTNPETGEPGLSVSKQALEVGKSVVFASKGPLVAGFGELVSLASRHGARMGFSAAVGTPLPSIEIGLLGLHGSRLHGFRGLLNETSNRILRDMEAGVSYEDALEGARRAGVLEADPRLDLEGWDTAYKALILARTFWRTDAPFDPSVVQGITEVSADDIKSARAEGRKIRLLGSGRKNESGDIHLQVEPVWLNPDDPLYCLGPGEKGAVFDTDLMGRVVIRSGKAGPFDTAAAVIKDVLNIVAHPSWIAA